MIFEKDLNIHIGLEDYSLILNDFQRDELDLILPSGEFIYVGLYKPFNALYWEFVEASADDAIGRADYFNGTLWTPLENYQDDTLSGSRSGFIKWKKPEDWTSSMVGTSDLFWIKFYFSVDFVAKIRAINILFSDDNDLKKELQSIEKYLAQGQISFAPTHQTVRDDIVQTLRNKGKIKYGPNQKFNQITKWDLLDISEVNLASKYFVLEKIFWQASGAPGDKFSVRQREAKSEGDKAFDLAFLSLDEDDTGKDPGKMNVRQMVYVERV